jgi:putative endopeptidase
MKIQLFKCLVCIFLICSCKNGQETDTSRKEAFLDINGIDTTIAPGDNYFRYINEKWINETSIPPTEIGAGSFFDLQTKSEKALLEVCQAAASIEGAPMGSLEQKVGDMYMSIMDTISIEAKGYSPLQPIFNKISSLKNTDDLILYVCEQNINGNDVLINFGVNADDKNVTKNIAQFFQGGLGLPDRDYYFRKDEATLSIQRAYKEFLNKIFSLTGDDSTKAKANAESVFNLESKIAAGHFTNVELRDPQKNYNKMGASQLQKMSPGLDWNLIKAGLLLKTDSVMIAQPAFFSSLDKLINSTPIDTWKPYFKAHTIKNSYNSLSKAFAQAGFEFFDKTLSGREQPEPRWKYAVNVVDSRIGELAGQLYVKKNFDQKAKERMMSLIDGLQKSYENRIKSLDWMSEATKDKALEKLASITRKIGFPDTWRKYDSLVITRDNYFQNRINTSRYEFFRAIAKVDKPVDRSEWQMTPPTVNAGYDPTKNEIIFPAGILQPPFFNANADDAINYGGIGMVIGHELTHGFDDQGRQYDKDGNLKDWWSKEDADKFKAITDKIVAQYAKYIPIDSLPLNGELTLGENIADIGGLAIAYDAFKMTPQGKSTEKVDGLTPDQRFFQSYATIWRIKMKDEFMRQIIHTDVHSPAEYRVVGPLSNHTPFYNAYGLTESNKMWKGAGDRIKVW